MSGASLAEGALPPWDCSVVHFRSDPGHTDVLLRCSHMIGDGQLFMQLLREVLDDADAAFPLDGSAGDAEAAGDAAGDAMMCGFGDEAATPEEPVLERDEAEAEEGEPAGPEGSDGSGSGAAPPAAVTAVVCPREGGDAGAAAAAGGSPTLIRAVHGKSAFLPPPSLERATRKSASRRGRSGPGAAAAGRRRRAALAPLMGVLRCVLLLYQRVGWL
jgi:hypothetical protein